MYSIYYIISSKTDSIYIGMTKKKLSERFSSHKHAMNKGAKSPLYDCMRKYGIENFQIILVDQYESVDDCCEAEIYWINFAKMNDWKLLNLAEGGQTGYDMSKDIRYAQWRAKLKEARQGRKPALGMRHSEENKVLFSRVSSDYWNTQDTYNPKEILSLSFKEAKEQYGISKTHYYRLLKRAKSNDLS